MSGSTTSGACRAVLKHHVRGIAGVPFGRASDEVLAASGSPFLRNYKVQNVENSICAQHAQGVYTGHREFANKIYNIEANMKA